MGETEKYFVYILTDKSNKTLFIGFTLDLRGSVWYYRLNIDKNSFASKRKLYKLVYFDVFTNIKLAVKYLLKLKSSRRMEKLILISSINSNWIDYLYGDYPKISIF